MNRFQSLSQVFHSKREIAGDLELAKIEFSKIKAQSYL